MASRRALIVVAPSGYRVEWPDVETAARCSRGSHDHAAAHGPRLGVRPPVDLRKGYNGLVGIVENELARIR